MGKKTVNFATMETIPGFANGIPRAQSFWPGTNLQARQGDSVSAVILPVAHICESALAKMGLLPDCFGKDSIARSLGDAVISVRSVQAHRLILPFVSDWPHVLKLSLRLLQPLAQVLGVFIVRVVVLFVRFQQRPQDFDATLFLITRSACSNSRTPVRFRTVFIGLQVFILCVVKCSPGGWGELFGLVICLVCAFYTWIWRMSLSSTETMRRSSRKS